jgi:hypothetical protein
MVWILCVLTPWKKKKINKTHDLHIAMILSLDASRSPAPVIPPGLLPHFPLKKNCLHSRDCVLKAPTLHLPFHNVPEIAIAEAISVVEAVEEGQGNLPII